MQRDIVILQTCARRLLSAQDGRGRRWPLLHCAQALQQRGATPALATACAQAVARVVETVQARAATWE